MLFYFKDSLSYQKIFVKKSMDETLNLDNKRLFFFLNTMFVEVSILYLRDKITYLTPYFSQ